MHPTIVLVHGAFAESSSWDARQLLGEATLGRSRAATARPTCTSSRTASISSSAQTCPSNGPRGYRAENSAAYQFAQPPPRSDDHPAVPRPPLGARRAWRSSLGKQSQHARACHQDMRTKRVEAVNDVGAVACIHSQCRDDRAFRRGTYKSTGATALSKPLRPSRPPGKCGPRPTRRRCGPGVHRAFPMI
jgi:hypothetical protein